MVSLFFAFGAVVVFGVWLACLRSQGVHALDFGSPLDVWCWIRFFGCGPERETETESEEGDGCAVTLRGVSFLLHSSQLAQMKSSVEDRGNAHENSLGRVDGQNMILARAASLRKSRKRDVAIRLTASERSKWEKS